MTGRSLARMRARRTIVVRALPTVVIVDGHRMLPEIFERASLPFLITDTMMVLRAEFLDDVLAVLDDAGVPTRLQDWRALGGRDDPDESA